MNHKIFFPQLATMLAQRSGRSKRVCEDFLREFFNIISQSIEEGETVKIKGFGTFRVQRVESRRSIDVTTKEAIEIPGHSRVTFTPSKEVAEKVNGPFEAFEAVELSDNFENDMDTDETLEATETFETVEAFETTETFETTEPSEVSESSGPTMSSSQEESLESLKSLKTLETLESEEQEELEEQEGLEEIGLSDNYAIEDSEECENEHSENESCEGEKTGNGKESDIEEETVDGEETEHGRRRNRFARGFFTGFACSFLVFAIGAGVFLYLNSHHQSDSTVKLKSTSEKMTENAVTDSVESVPKELTEAQKAASVATLPSDNKVVYDTISRTRFLTTMAKEHYGNFNLWPYIYEENKSFLRHPDRIKPGTPVVVPPLSKYGIDPNSPADIEKGRRLGAEIYARYR